MVQTHAKIVFRVRTTTPRIPDASVAYQEGGVMVLERAVQRAICVRGGNTRGPKERLKRPIATRARLPNSQTPRVMPLVVIVAPSVFSNKMMGKNYV